MYLIIEEDKRNFNTKIGKLADYKVQVSILVYINTYQ